jgi:general secretion pathway protein B
VAVPAQPRAPEADSAARVLALNELPDDVRRSLPALTVNGASYSETPAHRMLIANGQVYREGDEPAPGLVLEQIRARSAVLRWRGVRYSVPY